MPPVVKTQITDIELFVRNGPKASWDIGTSRAVIEGDEYSLRAFRTSPERHQVQTIVDVGANIGAFTLLARHVFPTAHVLAVEPDPDNAELLKLNCGDDPFVTICETAVLGDDAPGQVQLFRHALNSGGSFVGHLYQPGRRPFLDPSPINVPCHSIHTLLKQQGVESIDLLKVDAEGSEVEIFSCLAMHGWLSNTKWIRFEWHRRDVIPRLRDLLTATHEVSIDETAIWNGLGVAHRKDLA